VGWAFSASPGLAGYFGEVAEPRNDRKLPYACVDESEGVTSLSLFVKTPVSGSFIDTGLAPSPGANLNAPGTTGVFNYTASAGDGAYQFYTIAADNASNIENAPAAADITVTLDSTVSEIQPWERYN
jgi:hypothetical protein